MEMKERNSDRDLSYILGKIQFKIVFMIHLTTCHMGNSSNNMEHSLMDLFVYTYILKVALIIGDME